jgi:hypothetical protein
MTTSPPMPSPRPSGATSTCATTPRDPRRALRRTGLELNEARLRMARIPDGATLIDNPVSAAPGFTLGNVHVMAGVPAIFEAMVASVLPTLTGGPPLLSPDPAAGLPSATRPMAMIAPIGHVWPHAPPPVTCFATWPPLAIQTEIWAKARAWGPAAGRDGPRHRAARCPFSAGSMTSPPEQPLSPSMTGSPCCMRWKSRPRIVARVWARS